MKYEIIPYYKYLCECGYKSDNRFSVISHKGSCRIHKIVNGILINSRVRSTSYKWRCDDCNLIFRTRNDLLIHRQKDHGIKSLTKNPDGTYRCNYCNRLFKNVKSALGHLRSCKNHPNKKYHDESYKRQGITYSNKVKSGLIIPPFTGKLISLSTRLKISEARSKLILDEYLNKPHAKVKWYKIKNNLDLEFSVRGTWELNVAKRLNELNILWTKAKPIKYFNLYYHNYTADLYIPDSDIYIEVKGNYSLDDREKMRLVCELNPNLKIYFIHDKYNDFINGKIEFNDDLLIKLIDL